MNRSIATDSDRAFMREAIRQMRQAGVLDRTGGPFGAIIVRDGTIVAEAGNSVIRDKDPTAHAEMNAIRQACKKLETFNLSGCTLYTSCECCPMCYAAAYWARVGKIFYAASWTDYEDLFDDSKINFDILQPNPKRLLTPVQILREEARTVWDEFRTLSNGARY
jgi:guanine deaminase